MTAAYSFAMLAEGLRPIGNKKFCSVLVSWRDRNKRRSCQCDLHYNFVQNQVIHSDGLDGCRSCGEGPDLEKTSLLMLVTTRSWEPRWKPESALLAPNELMN